jgi:uncharacterized protein
MEAAVYLLLATGTISIVLLAILITKTGRPATLPAEFTTRIAVLERIVSDLPTSVREEGRLSREDLRGVITAASQLQSDALSAMRQEASDGREKLEGAVQRNADAFAQTQTERLRETNDIVRDLSDRLSKAQEAAKVEQRNALEGVTGKIAVLIEANDKKQEALRGTVSEGLEKLRTDNADKLEKMRATVEEKLQGTLEKRLGESFQLVSDRLEQVHKGLGEMQTLATGVGDLRRVLTNVKSRGGWGEGEVTNAGDSIVEYDRWRVTGKQAILDAIERYNEDDCISTAKMRDWLETLRPAGSAVAQVAVVEDDETAERRAQREAFQHEREELAARVRASTVATAELRELIAEMLWFHQRSQKPQYWSLFDRQTWTDEELIDDLEGLGGLVLESVQRMPAPARSMLATYRFPPQDTKIRKGDQVLFAADLVRAGSIYSIDPSEGLIVLKRGANAGEFPEHCGLSPNWPVSQVDLVAAVMRFAERVANGDDQRDRALFDLLLRRNPTLKGRNRGAAILTEGEDLVAGTIRAVRNLDYSTLFIQGPPGTGKTYTASHAILDLLCAGKRVAVSSNSHKAIINLLKAVEKQATNLGFDFRGAKKASHNDPETELQGRYIEDVYDSDDVQTHHRLVGGTAFHFCKSAGEEPEFDYLFVDEAGQVCLANLIAISACARNIVLIGDQMQLPQPVQGVHPGDTGLSCLDYLLQGRATVPPELGILLNTSWRMHPNLCRLISEAIYEGRLTAHPSTAERCLINASELPAAGVAYLHVEHEGCRQASDEEVRVVSNLVRGLLTARVQEGRRGERELTLEDILVVAPYNMQVNWLRHALPEGSRVGTVDKFQGQEAAVVIVSMATSSAADASRGTEFLFNRNRLNVALSRAECVAVVVAGAHLLEAEPGTTEDLTRLDFLARAEAQVTMPSTKL